MATPAANIALLERYFQSRGDWGPAALGAPEDHAMRELVLDAAWDLPARRLFAQHSIFERTLNPPSIVSDTFVRPSIQLEMLEGIYRAITGGFWMPPTASGITEWIGSEAGGRAYFLSALNSGPRVYDPGSGSKIEIEMDPEVLAYLLKILRDAALPVAWLGPFMEQQVFQKLETRIAAGGASPATRRTLLALVGQAQGRVSSELAKVASAQIGSFPSFQTGDGLAPTVPPPPKRWYRNGWTWIATAAGVIGGGGVARSRRR